VEFLGEHRLFQGLWFRLSVRAQLYLVSVEVLEPVVVVEEEVPLV